MSGACANCSLFLIIKHQYVIRSAPKNGIWNNDPIKKNNRQMRSVWQIPTPGKSEKIFGKHPTQKPLGLLKRVVASSTNPGQKILDPFSGSSTTGVVAHSMGRNFVGIDSCQEYLDLSIARFENAGSIHVKKRKAVDILDYGGEGNNE